MRNRACVNFDLSSRQRVEKWRAVAAAIIKGVIKDTEGGEVASAAVTGATAAIHRADKTIAAIPTRRMETARE